MPASTEHSETVTVYSMLRRTMCQVPPAEASSRPGWAWRWPTTVVACRSGYGTARALAGLLGFDEAVDLLTETLNEEKATDEKLTELAVSAVNLEAASVE